jgi:hypothetical protein
MYRDFLTLRRGLRAEENRAGAAGSIQRRAARFLGISALCLAGCVGSIGQGNDPDNGSPSNPTGPGSGDPNNNGNPGNPGTNPPVNNVPPPVASTCKADQIGLSPLRRLTQVEYDNTVKDLLGVDLGLAQQFNADETAGPFPSNYFTPVSESSYGQYASAASTIAGKAVEKLPTLLPCAATVQPAAEAGCANTFIKQFGRRTYRRPLDSEEVGRYEALFRQGRDGGTFATGISLVVEAMLESPHFLYLVEGPGPLTQHQLATRLSYFLWKGPPDTKLATLADTGGLRTPESLSAEAKRMLADPRAQAMIDDFHMHWLALDDLVTGLDKDPEKYPDFAAVEPLLREELKRFTNHVFAQGDGKLETLLTANFTFANPALAKLYGAKTTGTDWQQVTLDGTQRAGFLSQSAFLATHGHETSAPIFRGIAIREQMFCVDLPPPPPGADALLPPAMPSQTTRQRLQLHRASPECASCHSLMDVLGYGFESFDDIGRYRTTENGVPIDDSGEFVGTDVDGAFKGPIELAQRMAQSKQVQQCVSKQWFRYALGRMETELDSCALDAVYEKFQKGQFRMPDLLLALVESDAFRIRRAEESK